MWVNLTHFLLIGQMFRPISTANSVLWGHSKQITILLFVSFPDEFSLATFCHVNGSRGSATSGSIPVSG